MITSIYSNFALSAIQNPFQEIGSQLKSKKFENHTGWKSEISFDKTMTDLLNYWRDEVLNSGSKFLIR